MRVPSPHMRYLGSWLAAFALDLAVLALLGYAGIDLRLGSLMAALPAAALALVLMQRYVFRDLQAARLPNGGAIPYRAITAAGLVLNLMILLRAQHIAPEGGIVFAALCVASGQAAAALGCWFLLQMMFKKAGFGTGATGDVTGPQLRGDARRILFWLAALLFTVNSPAALHQLQGILSLPAPGLPLAPADPDPWLRLAQVRQWLTAKNFFGDNFFNHAVAHTNAPFGGIETPWTRPVDFLLAALQAIMPGADIDRRLLLAAFWMPALLTLGSLLFLSRAAQLQVKISTAIGVPVLLFCFSSFYYLAPGNSDHHGLLSMLWCGSLWLLLKPQRRAAEDIALGAFSGLSIWISPEGLVTYALLLGLIGLEALAKPQQARGMARATFACAAVCFGALFIERPPALALAAAAYDTLSIVQASLLGFVALAACGLAVVLPRLQTLSARFCTAAVAGLAALAAEYACFPGFYDGPMRGVDPVIRTVFLPRISEAKSLFLQPVPVMMQVLVWLLPAALLLAVTLSRKRRADTRRPAMLLAACLAATFLMTALEARWQYYLQPVSILVIAAFLPAQAMAAGRLRATKLFTGFPRWSRAYALLCVIYFAALLLARVTPAALPDTAAATHQNNALCLTQLRAAIETGRLTALLGNGSLIVYASRDLGGELQFFTPYRIIASNYHREGKGYADMIAIETASAPAAALPLLQKRAVDAFILCPGIYPADSWLRRLPAEAPEWLEPVEGLQYLPLPGPRPLIYRMKHQ